jgi:ABC-2 type transport system ATP-binding protein
METVIRVTDVYKKFKVYFDKGQTMKERLLFRNRNRYEDRWVLKGVSLEVGRGEAIGIIGRNGCGKSTLLKLMTKIMYPDKGEISMKGRVASLIELGAGFHPDMNGRENIYTNGAIFGLSRKEIDARIDNIVAFSELGDYIDNPVRTYSSGMYMRLAFSVAINVNADILLIDEILAVGDAGFREKCFDWIKGIKSKGVTIVIVAHSLGDIEKLCERSYWINDGIVAKSGIPAEVHPVYNEYIKNHKEQIV